MRPVGCWLLERTAGIAVLGDVARFFDCDGISLASSAMLGHPRPPPPLALAAPRPSDGLRWRGCVRWPFCLCLGAVARYYRCGRIAMSSDMRGKRTNDHENARIGHAGKHRVRSGNCGYRNRRQLVTGGRRYRVDSCHVSCIAVSRHGLQVHPASRSALTRSLLRHDAAVCVCWAQTKCALWKSRNPSVRLSPAAFNRWL